MKIKTINTVINKKFDEFIASISDESVKKLVETGTIITGGCIASMLLKEKVNDFDLYFKDKLTALAVAHYYVNKFNEVGGSYVPEVRTVDVNGDAFDYGDRIKIYIKSAGVVGTIPIEQSERSIEGTLLEEADEISSETLEIKEKYLPVFLTSNAITLSGQIQLIIRFYGTPENIHENYDFVHCTNYWTSWDRKCTVNSSALESLLSKELRYIGSKYPICSIIRTRKFIARQWTINAGQYLKMIMQASELDLSDLRVLEDQLVGVDASYFNQVIFEMSQRNKETIEIGYLMTILDRIF